MNLYSMNNIPPKNIPEAPAQHDDIPSLTGLRFLAAISVAMAHGALLTLGNGEPLSGLKAGISTAAGFGMTLFFVLSGFVIHYNYRTVVSQQGLSGLGHFLWARFARLYPLFLLMLVLDIFLSKALREAVYGEMASLHSLLQALPYYLLFLHSWIFAVINNNSLIYQIGNNVVVTWSISTEWFFYLAYPAICFGLVRIKRPIVLWCVAILWSLAFCVCTWLVFDQRSSIDAWAAAHFGPVAVSKPSVQDSLFRWMLYFSPYSRIGEFGLGCFTAHLFALMRSRPIGDLEAKIANLAVYAVVATIPLILYLTFSPGGLPLFSRLQFNYGLAPNVAALIFLCARYRSLLSRWLATPFMVTLGGASYSIYMVHLLLFSSVPAIGAGRPGSYTEAYLVARYLFLLSGIVLIAVGLYATFETPARRWLRGILSGSGQPRKKLIGLIVLLPFLMAALSLQVDALIGSKSQLQVVLPDSGISVSLATYGKNCGAPAGNATQSLRAACNGQNGCAYKVDVNVLGDPAQECSKDFSVTYSCMPDSKSSTIDLPGEAGLGSIAKLNCGSDRVVDSQKQPEEALPQSGISISSATYGKNCGAPAGNSTKHLRTACDGKDTCPYNVDVSVLGDPAAGCSKDFSVAYICLPSKKSRELALPGEAGFGTIAALSCK